MFVFLCILLLAAVAYAVDSLGFAANDLNERLRHREEMEKSRRIEAQRRADENEFNGYGPQD